jgi:hypothetical protein
MPAGHQACSTLSRCVFSAGYNAAVTGLIEASVAPQPTPAITMPMFIMETMAGPSPAFGEKMISAGPAMKHSEASNTTRLHPNTSRKGLMTSSEIAKPKNPLPSAVAISSPERAASMGSNTSCWMAPATPERSEKDSAAVTSASTQIQKIALRL